MAGIRIQETAIPDFPIQPPKTESGSDSAAFKKLMDKITNGKKMPVSLQKLSDDGDVDSAAKNIVRKIFNGTSPEDAKAEIENLRLDDADKAELMGILGQIMNAIDNGGNAAQGILNRLFFGVDSASENGDALQKLYDSLAALKDDEDVTSLDAMAQLVAMLLASENGSNLITEDMLPKPGGEMVGIDGGISISKESLRNSLSELIALVGSPAPVDPEIPVGPVGPTGPSIIPPPVGPPVDVNPPVVDPPIVIDPPVVDPPVVDPPVVDPPVVDPPVGPIGPGGPSVTEPPTTPPVDPTANDAIPVAAFANNPAIDAKTMAEANAARAASGRVKRSDELSEIDANTISGMRGHATQFQAIPIVAEEARVIPVQTQILNNIAETLSTIKPFSTSEITMTLNPQNLGEISVKMVREAGQVLVTIAAQSEATQKLLADRLPALLQNLQAINSDVKEVRVDSAQNSQLSGFNLNSFAQNTTSDQQGQAQSERAAQMARLHYAEEAVPVATVKTSDFFKGGNRLWQTV